MKEMLIISLLFVLGCTTLQDTHSNLNLTKMYVGKYVDSEYVESEGHYFVTTTMGIFRVKDSLSVPDSALCYIRRDYSSYDFHPDIAWQMETQYLTWYGTEEEYRLKKNIDFRRVK
jgi:hypothetical protein